MVAYSLSDAHKACSHAIVLSVGLNGLGAMRSLRQAGIKPIPVFFSPLDVGTKSNRFDRHYMVDGKGNWEPELFELLKQVAPPNPIPVISCSDRTAEFLLTHRESLQSQYALLIPPNQIITILNDKRMEIEELTRHEVPLPRSQPDLTPEIFSREPPLDLPIIVKPRTHADFSALGGDKNVTIQSRQAWLDFYREYGAGCDRLIAQQIVPGDDENLWVCNATFDRSSSMVCGFTFRRLGTSPPHYGVTSLAQSEINERVLALVRRIGQALNFVGPGMFEFKYDRVLDDYLYIETNPRLGLCNWFDTSCGINNAAATCVLAMGCELADVPVQSDRRVFVNFAADFVSRLEDGQTLREIFATYWNYVGFEKVYAFFFLRDIRPFLYRAKVSLKRYFKPMARYCVRVLSAGRR